jgi:hypothetical protein
VEETQDISVGIGDGGDQAPAADIVRRLAVVSMASTLGRATVRCFSIPDRSVGY